MARPKVLVATTLSLRPETMAAVEALARERSTTRGSVLRQGVEEFMRRQAFVASPRLTEPVPAVGQAMGPTDSVASPVAAPSANGDYIKCGLCAPASLPIRRAELPGHVAAHRAAFEQELAAATKR